MKLIDILVEELEEWPAVATAAWQSKWDREIYFCTDRGVYYADDYYSRHTADVRGEAGTVTREEYFEAVNHKKEATLYHCPTCNSPYPRENAARYCCEIKTSQLHKCTDCHQNHPSYEAADICCRSVSKNSKVEVKTLLQATFDLLHSHRELSDNDYVIVGSNSLDDIGGMLQDFIEQNEIHGFGEN